MLHGLHHLPIVLFVALGQPLPLVGLAAHIGVALRLNFGGKHGAALFGLLDPLRLALLPVKGILHVLAGDDLEGAAESLGWNVGLPCGVKIAVYRLPALP